MNRIEVFLDYETSHRICSFYFYPFCFSLRHEIVTSLIDFFINFYCSYCGEKKKKENKNFECFDESTLSARRIKKQLAFHLFENGHLINIDIVRFDSCDENSNEFRVIHFSSEIRNILSFSISWSHYHLINLTCLLFLSFFSRIKNFTTSFDPTTFRFSRSLTFFFFFFFTFNHRMNAFENAPVSRSQISRKKNRGG